MKKKQFLKLLDELNKHIVILEKNLNYVKEIYGFNKETIEDLIENEVEILDSIAYRFSKLQYSILKTLRVYFELNLENVDNLSNRDILELAYKRGILSNVKEFLLLREVRNILTNEYQDDLEKIANVLEFIDEKFNILKNLYKELK